MSNFPLAGKPVTHPGWCDPERCTAPETYPAEYTAGARQYHRSVLLGGEVFDGDQIYLSQSAGAPWECNTYLVIETADQGHGSRHLSVPLETSSPLLWAVLAQATDLDREFRLLMEVEAAKRGRTWRPLWGVDELPEPRDASPLAGATIAGERETTQTEIVIGGAGYGDPELDGTACISCHEGFAVGEASVPAGVVSGGPMVFAHHACLFVRVPTPELAALLPLPGGEVQEVEEKRTPGLDPGGPYWLVRYVKGQSARPEISLAVAAGDAMTASRNWAKWSPEGSRAIDVHGPFDSREAAYTHRSAWQETEGSR